MFIILLKSDFNVSPISAGLGETLIPTDSRTVFFSSAEPELPDTIAPAWPFFCL